MYRRGPILNTSQKPAARPESPLLTGLGAWLPWLALLFWLLWQGQLELSLWAVNLVVIAMAGLMLLLSLVRAMPLAGRLRDPALWFPQALGGVVIMLGVLLYAPSSVHLPLLLAGLPWITVHGVRLGSMRTAALCVLAAGGAFLIALGGGMPTAGPEILRAGLEAASYLIAASAVVVAIATLEVHGIGSGGRARGVRKALNEAARPRLLNRADLVEVLERERARANRQNTPLSVCLMDVDDLNRIHLERGQAAVDTISKAFGNCMLARIRQMDVVGRRAEDDETIGRYEGREFIAVLPGTPTQGAVSFADRIRSAMSKLPLRADGERLTCTVSAGVARYRPEESVGVLLLRAESALHRAQRLGPNRVEKETAGEAVVPSARKK